MFIDLKVARCWDPGNEAARLLDEPHGAEVLHDGGVDATIDALDQVMQRVVELAGLTRILNVR
jgi:hypothetical protein